MTLTRFPLALAIAALGFPAAGHAAVSGTPLWTLTQSPESTDFSQPGANQPKYFTSPDPVQAGTTYTIVIEGQAHTKNAHSSYSYDGVWQYDYQPSSAQPNPQRCCIDMQIAGHEGHPVRPGESPSQSVPFESKTHYYKVKYVPSDSGNLEVRDVMRSAQGFTTIDGQITFELYSGSGPASSGGGGGGGTHMPSLSSPSKPPKLDVNTDYKVMALGATGVFDGPTPPGGVDELDTEIHFIDSKGDYAPSPPIAAIQEKVSKAIQICFILGIGPAEREGLTTQGAAYLSCVDTVSRILARADQIQQQGAARAHAAGAKCPSVVRGPKGARPQLRVSCSQTATGARISIRPRLKGKTLAQVLHGRAPQLVVGRSSIPAGNPTRLRVRWTAR